MYRTLVRIRESLWSLVNVNKQVVSCASSRCRRFSILNQDYDRSLTFTKCLNVIQKKKADNALVAAGDYCIARSNILVGKMKSVVGDYVQYTHFNNISSVC